MRSPEEEGTVETECVELTTNSIPCPPVPLWEEEVEKIGSNVKQERKGAVGEGILRFSYHLPLLCADLIGNILISLSP